MLLVLHHLVIYLLYFLKFFLTVLSRYVTCCKIYPFKAQLTPILLLWICVILQYIWILKLICFIYLNYFLILFLFNTYFNVKHQNCHQYLLLLQYSAFSLSQCRKAYFFFNNFVLMSTIPSVLKLMSHIKNNEPVIIHLVFSMHCFLESFF